MLVSLRADQGLHHLLDQAPQPSASSLEQPFPKALSGPKLPLGRRTLQVGGFRPINLPDVVASYLSLLPLQTYRRFYTQPPLPWNDCSNALWIGRL